MELCCPHLFTAVSATASKAFGNSPIQVGSVCKSWLRRRQHLVGFDRPRWDSPNCCAAGSWAMPFRALGGAGLSGDDFRGSEVSSCLGDYRVVPEQKSVSVLVACAV